MSTDSSRNWHEAQDAPYVRRRAAIKFRWNSPDLEELTDEIRNAVGIARQELSPYCAILIGHTLESLFDDYDAQLNVKVHGPRAIATTYTTRCTWVAIAKATVLEAEVQLSVFSATVRGPTALARAKVGIGGVSVFANALLCRAEVCAAGLSIGMGIDTSTGLSIGLDGIRVNFLGFGFGIGPRIVVRTPFVDFSSCAVM